MNKVACYRACKHILCKIWLIFTQSCMTGKWYKNEQNQNIDLRGKGVRDAMQFP